MLIEERRQETGRPGHCKEPMEARTYKDDSNLGCHDASFVMWVGGLGVKLNAMEGL